MNNLTLCVVIISLILFLWLTPMRPIEAWLIKLSQLRISAANRLYLQLGQVEAACASGRLDSLERLAQYKFFTTLTVALLDHARKYGASIKQSVKELRQALGRDIASEREISALVRASYIQFAIVSSVTWIFVTVSKVVAEIEVNLNSLILMIVLQLMGAAIFYFLCPRLRRHYFSKLDSFLSAQYKFKGLCAAGLGTALVVKKSGLDQLLVAEYKGDLALLKLRLLSLIKRWQKSGQSILGEWDDGLEESWALHKLYFSHYLKAMEALKFTLLALFFLSSYFIFIGSLFIGFLGPS